MKLLIVDDSSVIRSRIARISNEASLSSLNIIGLAKNGHEAVRICKVMRPDLVTMDLTMPEMDGVSCIAELLMLQPGMNILVISALSDRTTAIQALKLGARGFLNKPFSDKQLIDALLEFANVAE
jgi:two-component system, chemotaxis family, chemotaxis protein CheY